MPASLIRCPGCGRSIDPREEVCAACRQRGERTIRYPVPERPKRNAPPWIWFAVLLAGVAAAFLCGLLWNVSNHLLNVAR